MDIAFHLEVTKGEFLCWTIRRTEGYYTSTEIMAARSYSSPKDALEDYENAKTWLEDLPSGPYGVVVQIGDECYRLKKF